jgi:hypothetical protein
MQSKIKWALIVASIFLAFSMLTCVNQEINNLRKDADLLELWVGSIPILESDPISGVVEGRPVPINTTEWNRDDFRLNTADFGRVAFYRGTDLRQQRVVTRVSPGARAQWGLGMRSTRPGEFIDTRVPITFESDEFIYIRVTAEDGVTINYYRFYTKLLSWTTDLSQIAIQVIPHPLDPEAAESFRIGKAGVPSTDYELASEASIGITTDEGQGAIIVPTTFDPNATVEFAVVAGDATETNEDGETIPANPEALFRPSSDPQTFADQDLLYVKVTAENTVDFDIFKFRVNVGRMPTINRLFFINNDPPNVQKPDAGKTIEIFGKGLPSGEWESVGFGSHETADPPVAGYSIKIQTDDPDAEYWFAKLTDSADTEPSYDDPSAVWFEQEEVLAIKVKSKNPDNLGNPIVMYYKIRVNLLAGNIKTHPKSAWYLRGATVTPLSVELDREGDFSYQWYHSDSLYGLYGRHGMELDEKNNVSTMNGGPSMYYYLVEPDSTDNHTTNQAWAWTLTGETNPTYTPRNDWIDVFPIETVDGNPKQPVPLTPPYVNFITGSTSEVRYYWVTVTDNVTGRTVTSDRCLILTETDPNMDHFIFDLSKLKKKNIVPFTTKKNDPYYGDDPYKFDVTDYMKNDPIAKNLDPSKYQICVAQAQYFLPDGRAWTQNWTHGDLHFGYNEGSIDEASGVEKGSLTWWHNNLGANAGAIPLQAPHASQGGLSFKPDWIGFKPSGDPDRGIPHPWPVSSNGVPTVNGLPKGAYPNEDPQTPAREGYPGGIAQGYFCGFIELLELRFATPPSQ